MPVDAPAEELAAKYATRRRFEKLAAKLDDRHQAVTFDRLYERILEDIVREEYKRLHHGDTDVNMQVFRSEIAALTREFLDSRNDDS